MAWRQKLGWTEPEEERALEEASQQVTLHPGQLLAATGLEDQHVTAAWLRPSVREKSCGLQLRTDPRTLRHTTDKRLSAFLG